MKRNRNEESESSINRENCDEEEYVVVIWHHEDGQYEINSTKISNLTEEQLTELRFFDGKSSDRDGEIPESFRNKKNA